MSHVLIVFGIFLWTSTTGCGGIGAAPAPANVVVSTSAEETTELDTWYDAAPTPVPAEEGSKSRWEDIDAVLAEPPAEPCIDHEFHRDEEAFLISAPTHAKVDADSFFIYVKLSDDETFYLRVGHEDLGCRTADHRRSMATHSWGIREGDTGPEGRFVLKSRDLLIYAVKPGPTLQEEGAGGYKAWFNVTAGMRTFCAHVYNHDRYDRRGDPSLPSVLRMLKCAASLRLKTPYPEDPIAASKRMGWEYKEPAPKTAGEVKKIDMGRSPSGLQMEFLERFPAVEEVLIRNSHCLAYGGELAPLRRLPELRTLELGSMGNGPFDGSVYYEQIAGCTKLERLHMEVQAASLSDIEKLCGLKSLVDLEFVVQAQAIPGLAGFAKLTRLRRLKTKLYSLGERERLPGGIASLAKAPALRSLEVQGRVADADLHEFGALTQLEELTIDSWRPSFNDLSWLEKLSSLRKLNLKFSPNELQAFDGAAARWLPSRLVDFELQKAAVSVSAAEAIGRLPALERFTLHGSTAPTALLRLAPAKSLKRVDLWFSDVPTEDVAKFRAARPDVYVDWLKRSPSE